MHLNKAIYEGGKKNGRIMQNKIVKIDCIHIKLGRLLS